MEWHAHVASSFTDQEVLPLCQYGNHFNSASRDVCLVILNLIVKFSWYFQFSRLNIAEHRLPINIILCCQNHWAFNILCKCSAVQSFTWDQKSPELVPCFRFTMAFSITHISSIQPCTILSGVCRCICVCPVKLAVVSPGTCTVLCTGNQCHYVHSTGDEQGAQVQGQCQRGTVSIRARRSFQPPSFKYHKPLSTFLVAYHFSDQLLFSTLLHQHLNPGIPHTSFRTFSWQAQEVEHLRSLLKQILIKYQCSIELTIQALKVLTNNSLYCLTRTGTRDICGRFISLD